MEIKRSCIDCGLMHCGGADTHFPEFCLSTSQLLPTLLEEARECYEEEENYRMMIHAANIESEFFCKMNRIEETIEFAKRMGYKRIGIATCAGLISESRILSKILRKHGFWVFGVACKAGIIKKVDFGIDESCNHVGSAICNPIHQAKRLAAENTEMNIVVGLCIGHDMIFNRYSEAPVTTLIVKDRVTSHNPAAPLYTLYSYNTKTLNNNR